MDLMNVCMQNNGFNAAGFSIDYGTSSFLSYLYNMTMIDYVEGLLEELEHYDSAHKLEDYENLERHGNPE